MNELTVSPFQFEGRNVRLVEQGGETWFVATDVARELGYGLATDLTKHLDVDEKGMCPVHTPGGEQALAVISEPGLYRAIVQRKTNKKHDGALTEKIGRFQRWVFHDILPTLRKHGRYEVAPPIAPVPPALPDFTNPATAARAWAEQFEGREIAETKATALESRVSELAPKADALDLIASANGSMCITDAAKALQLRPKSLFTFLRQRDWIYRRDGAELGYQDKVAAGYLEHKTTIIDRDGVKETRIQVRVTPKGLTALARKFPFAALPSA